MEQVEYNLLCRWFIGLSMDDAVWVPPVFTRNRERLIKHDAMIEFFNEVLAIAEKKAWLSGEHFSVDGTLVPCVGVFCRLLPLPEEYNNLQSYFERLVMRPSVKRVLEESRPYFSLYPFAGDIPERFL